MDINQNHCISEKLPSQLIWNVYHHSTTRCYHHYRSGCQTITTDLGVKMIMPIWVSNLSGNPPSLPILDTSLFAYLFILYSCSSLHHPNQLVHLSVPGTSQIKALVDVTLITSNASYKIPKIYLCG